MRHRGGLVLGLVTLCAALLAMADQAVAAPDDTGARATKSKYVTIERLGTWNHGLNVDRRWRMAKADPRTLAATITVRNRTNETITEPLVEPIPATGLQRIRFTKEPTVETGPGLARMTVTLPPQGSQTLRYVARLAKDRKATAKTRMHAIEGELEQILVTAEPAPNDVLNATWLPRYSGQVRLDTAIGDQLEVDQSHVGEEYRFSVALSPRVPTCVRLARNCEFAANDNAGFTPKLSALTSGGAMLVAEATGRRTASEDGSFTCSGNATPTNVVRMWSLTPSKTQLTWDGWQVKEVAYSLIEDASSEPARFGNVGCLAAKGHLAWSGVLSG
jgi:hypothetical protein